MKTYILDEETIWKIGEVLTECKLKWQEDEEDLEAWGQYELARNAKARKELCEQLLKIFE